MYTISRDIIERINVEFFRDLLREHQLPVSGIKPEVISRIQQVINCTIETNTLTVEKLEEFLANHIAHGKNRMLFISYFPPSSSANLSNLRFVKESLEAKELPSENFNSLRTTTSPEETELVYLRIYENEQVVNQISMCFAKSIADPDEDLIVPSFETDYIWVDLLPNENTLIIKIRPKRDYRDITTKELYEEISIFVKELFSLVPKNMESSKNTLYKIFKDLTHTAEKPFKERVEPLTDVIKEFSTNCATQLGIPNAEHPINLPYRVFRLLERALIQQEFDNYESYFEGKRGIVRRIYFSDLTGASVNARSSHLSEGIAVADIYFDTRDTIEEMKKLEKIWVEWFYFPDPEKSPERIETRMEVFKEHIIIHFKYAYIEKEVEEVVLSNFKFYESLPS